MNCDLLVQNAKIISVWPEQPILNWMAIESGKISSMGLGNPPSSIIAKETIDAIGCTILPGFIDSHVHGTCTGEALFGLNLDSVKSTNEILDKIEKHCKSNPDAEIITAYSFLRESVLPDKPPTAEMLDEISRDQIIIIYDKSYHGCILNSKGLKAAKVTFEMDGIEQEKGKMTGSILDDTSYYHAIRNIMTDMSEQMVKQYMRATNDYALSKGITSIHSLDGGDFIVDAPVWVSNNSIMDIHVVNYWETMDFEKVEEMCLPRIGGCLCLDGSRVVHTMALFEPYSDKPNSRGRLYYKEEDIFRFVETAHKKSMQCAMHATGDRAIDQYIYILNQVIKEQGQKNLRHRIEHFSMPCDKHIEMAAELELALPMQPVFSQIWDKSPQDLYCTRFGAKRAARVEPLAKIINAGCIVCGGSDSPVTLIDPLKGIEACINNPREERNIPLHEALKMFTYNGAWAAHEEKERGSLEPGKIADFVFLSEDPYGRREGIDRIAVLKTFIAGKLHYEKKVL